MKLDRMELADCTTPEKLLHALLKQMPDLPVPVPIEDIAAALDIHRIEQLDTDGFEGGLVTFADKSSGTILVNRQSPRQRQRFTIGHELGHFLNPWHVPVDGDGFRCTAGDMRKFGASSDDRAARMEAEANRFSAGILMPDPHFRKDLHRLGGPEMEHILELSEKYETSWEASARKYVALHDEPCAIVFSRNGSVLYGVRNEDFPFLDVRKGQPLPKGSVSLTNELGDDTCSGWEEVDVHAWLSDARNASSLAEQTFVQRDGYRMTLLYAELDDAREADGDLEKGGAPRFRR